MPSHEFLELKEMIEAVDHKVSTIVASLAGCRQRCIVDNPPSRWRSLGRALAALVKF